MKHKKPTKALLITPMPSEIKAASIRNEAVAAINANQLANVSFFYLKSKIKEQEALDGVVF